MRCKSCVSLTGRRNLSKDTARAIMDKVNLITNTSKEGVAEAAYVSTIPTAGIEVIDNLIGGDPGSPAKRLKTFVPPGIEIFSYPVMEKYISKIKVHLNYRAEVIIRAQGIIFLLNSNMVDVPEDHTKIWCAMGDIMNKLISHGAVLDNIDLDSLMR